VETWREMLELMAEWRWEGVTDVCDPMPIAQGWLAEDYVRCVEGLELVAGDMCEGGRLPELMGVGSVCRRQLHGPAGLLAILRALDEVLPAYVRLHLFGVKGALIPRLGEVGDRVASVDSMAWDFAARKSTTGPVTVEVRAQSMRRWVQAQRAAAREPSQLGLRFAS